mmetsp:Transcript_151621/g.486540  ORF Transcript_151621/g.486540 Transcript_151621/m.486540 type:complete len:84 (+) Transcript_151621:861-1112(+)
MMSHIGLSCLSCTDVMTPSGQCRKVAPTRWDTFGVLLVDGSKYTTQELYSKVDSWLRKLLVSKLAGQLGNAALSSAEIQDMRT